MVINGRVVSPERMLESFDKALHRIDREAKAHGGVYDRRMTEERVVIEEELERLIAEVERGDD
jgi:hypothetical protein